MSYCSTKTANLVYAIKNSHNSVDQLYRACKVITTNEVLSQKLCNEDPKALEQIENAVLVHETGRLGPSISELRALKGTEWPTEAEVADEVSSLINKIGFNHKAFAEKMGCEHRTLQQTFTGCCLAWFNHLAALPGPNYWDARNERSVEIAKKFVKWAEDNDLFIGGVPSI